MRLIVFKSDVRDRVKVRSNNSLNSWVTSKKEKKKTKNPESTKRQFAAQLPSVPAVCHVKAETGIN